MEDQTSRSLTILLGASYKIRLFKYCLELTSRVVHVLCGFSAEFLKISREFSLLFENTMKMFQCFIVFFR